MSLLPPRRIRVLDDLLGGPGSTQRFVHQRRMKGETVEEIAEHLTAIAAGKIKRLAPNTLRYWIRVKWNQPESTLEAVA